MGVTTIQEQIKKFQQPGPFADQVAFTVKAMRKAGCSDEQIMTALKALCEARED